MLTQPLFFSRACCGWTVHRVQTASTSPQANPRLPALLWSVQKRLFTVNHAGLCIFGYTAPPTWSDLSLNVCYRQDSLLCEALRDNPSPFALSLLLPTSLQTSGASCHLSVVEWALEAGRHSPALPLPGCGILSKLLPLSEPILPQPPSPICGRK